MNNVIQIPTERLQEEKTSQLELSDTIRAIVNAVNLASWSTQWAPSSKSYVAFQQLVQRMTPTGNDLADALDLLADNLGEVALVFEDTDNSLGKKAENLGD